MIASPIERDGCTKWTKDLLENKKQSPLHVLLLPLFSFAFFSYTPPSLFFCLMKLFFILVLFKVEFTRNPTIIHTHAKQQPIKKNKKKMK